MPRHDAEVVGDSVAEKCPLLRDRPPEELEEGGPELAEGRVVAVVGHKVVHQPPASLNGIEVGTVWRDEVQHALAPRLVEPVLHFDGVMIARIVEENVDSPFPCRRGSTAASNEIKLSPVALGTSGIAVSPVAKSMAPWMLKL